LKVEQTAAQTADKWAEKKVSKKAETMVVWKVASMVLMRAA